MNRIFRYLSWLVVLLSGPSFSYGLTIPASEDSSSVSSKLTTAGNNSGVLAVDAVRKAYVYFDLSEIPTTAVVRWAKLRLFLPQVRVKGSGVNVHTVSGEWNEALQSAAPVISVSRVGTIGADKLASKRFVTVDVTSTVQSWINLKTPNEGFAFVSIPNATPTLVTAINFASKEGIMGGLPAELDIEFKPEAEAPAPVTVEQLPSPLKPLLSSGFFALNDLSQLPPALRSFLTPSITVQPSLLSTGGSLTVQAQGLGSLSYQWMLNGVPVLGGTSAQLPSTGLVSGTYAVTVTNGFSSVTSAAVQIKEEAAKMVVVLGGTLPKASGLAGQVVGDFQIGKYEVTWAEWKRVQEWAVDNGYTDLANVGAGTGDTYPVTDVSWYDVVKWSNAKSEKEGKTPVYEVNGATYRSGQIDPTVKSTANGYRLPTEAEWEWAARGGRETHGYLFSGSEDSTAVGWCGDNSGGFTHAVGTKAENELGISDMTGNVWEWCWDLIDGTFSRSFRGGSFNYEALRADVSGRGNWGFPDKRGVGTDLGFRIACNSGQ